MSLEDRSFEDRIRKMAPIWRELMEEAYRRLKEVIPAHIAVERNYIWTDGTFVTERTFIDVPAEVNMETVEIRVNDAPLRYVGYVLMWADRPFKAKVTTIISTNEYYENEREIESVFIGTIEQLQNFLISNDP